MAVDFVGLVNRLLSASLQGQQELFDRFVSSSPRFQNITPIAQRALGQQFAPLSARYIVEAARPGNEKDFGSFADYVKNNLEPGLPTSAPLGQALSGTSALFPEAINSFPELQSAYPATTLPNDPLTEARRKLLEDETFGRNIIESAAAEGINPLLRRFIPDIISRRISQFQAGNPQTPLFGEFVRRGFRF